MAVATNTRLSHGDYLRVATRASERFLAKQTHLKAWGEGTELSCTSSCPDSTAKRSRMNVALALLSLAIATGSMLSGSASPLWHKVLQHLGKHLAR